MKALIISDVHSNVYALQAIWQQESDSDVVYCAGDLVDYGPFPKETLDWIRAHKVVCVQGNHDAGVVACYRDNEDLETMPPAEREWRHHNALRLSEADIGFLEQLPKTAEFTMDGIHYGVRHLFHDYETIQSLPAFRHFRARAFGAETGESMTRLIFGHTHRRAVHYLSDDDLWLNPGSASYRRPDDPSQAAHYAIIVDGTIHLKAVAYDLSPLYKAVKEVTLKEPELEVAYRFFGPR